MRKRTKEVLFRMTADEYSLFERKVEESGLPKQKYLLALALEKSISTGKELEALTELNKNMAVHISSINQVVKDLDDIATFSAIFGELPDKEGILNLMKEINDYKKEGMKLWQSLRLLIKDQSHVLD